MPHISREELLRASEAGRAEIERLAPHLSTCLSCRALAASLLEERAIPATREVPLKTLLELAAFERESAVARLLARAEWAGIRKLTKGAQKERVIRSRLCHTPAFLDVLLTALRASHPKEEAEFLSSLAVLAVQGMDLKRDSAEFKNDLLATIWTETANVRRIKGEWQHSETALRRTHEHLDLGTGSPSIKARWLSISASLRTDQGARDAAMAHLEECRRIYERQRDWPHVARTLVQMAHCIADHDPERALAFLDRAEISIPAEDPTLRWLAESIRAECLIDLGRLKEAFSAFGRAECLRPLQQRPNGKLRSMYTAGRLLEALGRMPEAEALFDEALSGDLHEGLHKDALLDLGSIVGFHVRRDAPERAAEAVRHTLREIERQGTVLHEQLQGVFAKLIEAARARSLDEPMLQEVGEYIRAHWKFPAPSEPVFTAREGVLVARAPLPVTEDEKLIESLLARARWSLIRRETRKEQEARVVATPECQTNAFVELLLSELRAAASRDEAEFIAHLALRAAEGMTEPAAFTEDFLARVWIEVANVRRMAAEWNHAQAALRRAAEHLAHGSGEPLLKARARSIAASLRGDQGHRAETVTILEECLKLYEAGKAWPLVARTLVQMAHTLVERDPARALALAEEALPFIPAEDPELRWLAESIRTESLIEAGDVSQSLQAFHLAESLRGGHARADAGMRSNYTAARLLEALGYLGEAEQLFESVIAQAFEREAYREAVLDILYLFGFHIRQGATDKAMALCQLAITQLDLFSVGHEQLRKVWVELREAAQRHAVTLESLAEVREFLQVHWKYPAAKAPSFSFRPHGS
jgi:tetratricopeptide (TPR) repeat protein